MSLRVVGLSFLLAGIVAAQPVRTTPAELKKLTWKIGETTREALVHIPAASDASPPLVFAFHGHGGKAEFSARKFAFHTLWPEAVVVYPQGLPTPVPVIDRDGKMPGWQKFVGDQKDRDLEFFDAMLKTCASDHRIDERRVYAAGHSNGGYFTYVLCAARGDKFAAVAPVAATLSIKDFKSQKPLPTLHVAGEKDPIVKYAGQQRTMEQMRKLNECDAEGKPAGKFCVEYRSEKGPPVVTYIHPGGHEIPDGSPRRIVEFFREHARK